jgi:nucleoside-diphosphate-sugar epimerase
LERRTKGLNLALVIVTGASGFIAASVIRLLRGNGHEVVLLDHKRGNVEDADYWNGLPRADHVIHLAGKSYVPDSWKAPADFLQTNVQGTARAIDYCRTSRAHLVFVSAYAYGIPQRLPIDESHPLVPNNPYALSKAVAEQICTFHTLNEKLPVTVVRPFNIFGPGQRPEFLISTLLDQIARGQEIRVKDLMPRRDFLYVDDLADGIVRTLNRPAGLRTVNFGSGVSYSVREIIDVAQAAAGTNLPVVNEGTPRMSEIPDVRADIRLARELLSWEPMTSLRDGIGLCLNDSRDRENPGRNQP